MADNQARATRWRDVVTGATTKPFYSGDSNVLPDGDRIYSYGRHFEMARAVRDARGKVSHFLVNGDVASQSTTRHQSFVRSAIRNDKSVIIPYSALESAGIELDSVKILEVTNDRWTPGTRRAVDKPWWWDDPSGDAAQRYSVKSDFHETLTPDGRTFYEWTDSQAVHHLGESLIRAKVTWHGRTADGGFGRKSRWATFLSGFDMGEARPLYFLAELPYRSKARTVADAYEALKPEPVLLAEAMGREVQRQGDIFAVPTPSVTLRELRKMGARIEKRGYILKTNHTASEVAYLPGGLTLVRGTMYHEPRGRVPDHARHTLGKQWHIVTKNTVPTTKRRAA